MLFYDVSFNKFYVHTLVFKILDALSEILIGPFQFKDHLADGLGDPRPPDVGHHVEFLCHREDNWLLDEMLWEGQSHTFFHIASVLSSQRSPVGW